MAMSGSLELKGVIGLSGVVVMAAAVVLAAPQVSASEAGFYKGKSISLRSDFIPVAVMTLTDVPSPVTWASTFPVIRA